ncbi:MAG: hypothetical protein ACI9WU_000319 [Myxococcota bacterium]|jgi:hypothetical protein
MVDKTALGAEGKPFVMDLERGKIAEFAEALQCALPEYMEGDAPLIPPTYLTSMFFWEARQEGADPWAAVKMSQERGMHAEQEFIFHGPVPTAGTRLTCTSRIAEVYDKTSRAGDRLEFAIKVTEFRDEAGTLVAEARMTGVERFSKAAINK